MQPRGRQSPVTTNRAFRYAERAAGLCVIVSAEEGALDDLRQTQGIARKSRQRIVQEQRRRINAMLQDYELQRRLHSEQLQFEQAQTQQAAVQVPGYQTLGTQSQ